MSIKKKQCRQCKQTLDNEKFHLNMRICKKCYSELQSKNRVERGKEFAVNLLQSEIISVGMEHAALTLFLSCHSRIQACKNDASYKGINCDWESPKKMTIDIINIKKKMWEEWIEQDKLFMETNNSNDRPSIDRIDNNGHYTLENIQMLSVIDNRLKDKGIISKALLFKDLRGIYSFYFNTKKDMKFELSKFGILSRINKIKLDFGIFQDIGNGYSVLIQSENGEVNQENSQDIAFIQTFEVIDEITQKSKIKIRGYTINSKGIEFTKNKNNQEYN